jgi:hypothetical protein
MKCKSTIRSILTHHRQNPTEIIEISRLKRDDNMNIDVKNKVSENIDWIHLVRDRVQWWALVNNVSIKGREFFD